MEKAAEQVSPVDASRSCRFEPQVEVRLAVVMYGGVSLAIYISGVAQELLRLVRATAPGQAGGKLGSDPLLGPEELRGSERVYRKLGQLLGDERRSLAEVHESDPIRRRVVVDILSGTSAGGINAILLAKALANQRPLDQVKQLWVSEGGIEKLINDRHSVRDLPRVSEQRPPQSLLDSRRMYLKLLEAFEGMEPEPKRVHGTNSPLVDEMDLFVTATDISGLPLPIRLADKTICERRYKNVFHFLYATESATGGSRNDFECENNPILAYAARCTSAFPFAFEPMTLNDVAELPPYRHDPARFDRDREGWEKFFKDYTRWASTCPGSPPDEYVRRAFSDGACLDNKPFSYATDALLRRRANVPVDRKMLYVEPSPEHIQDKQGPVERPDVLQNVVAAVLTLPRQETIREDLARVFERNRLIERVRRILNGTEADVTAFHNAIDTERSATIEGDDWVRTNVRHMIKVHGPTYGAYHRLKVSQLTDELAALVCRLAGLDKDSDDYLAVRHLVRAWRSQHYVPNPRTDSTTQTEGRFLLDFDLSYRLRRLAFILDQVDGLYPLNKRSVDIYTGTGKSTDLPTLSPEDIRAARAELPELKQNLSQVVVDLRKEGRFLRSPIPENPAFSVIEKLAVTRDDLRALLAEPDERARQELAQGLLSQPGLAQQFEDLAKALSEHAEPVLRKASSDCQAILNPPGPSWVRRCLWHYYQHYEDYDLIRFPIITGTGASETDEVEVFRVSPEDATALVNEEKSNFSKLAGITLHHFGAFLDKVWRQSDILWGRLDAAERLITALLPGHPEKRKLVLEASAEILVEELQPDKCDHEKARRVVVEAFLHAKSDSAGEKALAKFAETVLGATSNTDLRQLLDPAALNRVYQQVRQAKTHPSREGMVKVMARSTEVVGRMLDGLADRYGSAGKRPAIVLIVLGRVLCRLAEVAVPRSFAQLFYKHWLGLLYLMEGFLLVGGVILRNTAIQRFALVALPVTALLDLAPRVLHAWIRGGSALRTAKRIGALLLAAILVLGIVKAVELVASLRLPFP